MTPDQQAQYAQIEKVYATVRRQIATQTFTKETDKDVLRDATALLEHGFELLLLAIENPRLRVVR